MALESCDFTINKLTSPLRSVNYMNQLLLLVK